MSFAARRGLCGQEQPLGIGGEQLHEWVFVTHHPREPLEMAGGTTFHFVTDGIEAALERAQQAAGGKDVAIAGGAQTFRP
jgi:dihydrofolate reductase